MIGDVEDEVFRQRGALRVERAPLAQQRRGDFFLIISRHLRVVGAGLKSDLPVERRGAVLLVPAGGILAVDRVIHAEKKKRTAAEMPRDGERSDAAVLLDADGGAREAERREPVFRDLPAGEGE